MADVPSIITFFFSSCASFFNVWFSTFPISLAASVGILLLVFKLYKLLM